MSYEEKQKEIDEKYGINLAKLEKEQEKLSKNLNLKDSLNINTVERVAAISNSYFKNKVISGVVLVDNNFEMLDKKYFIDRSNFPNIATFRAYREFLTMISAFNMLETKPDIIFVQGHGVLHPRGFGIASHLSLSIGIPTIGIATELLVGDIKNEDILVNGKVLGKVVKIKEGASPIYVSPGNLISVESAAELTRRFTRPPHKLPEPLRLARKYSKEVMKEMFF